MNEAAFDPESELKELEKKLNQDYEKALVAFKGPSVSRSGSTITIEWPGRSLSFNFSSVREDGRGIVAELEVVSKVIGRLSWGGCNLLALNSQEGLIKKLSSKLPLENRADWPNLVEKSFHLAGETFRRGEPVVLLQANTVQEDCGYAITPLIPRNEVSFIFADGGSGKSYLSLFLACAYSLGLSLPNGIAIHKPGNVMILDWESTDNETAYRLTKICRGFGMPMPAIFYRRMSRLLDDELERVRKEITEKKIDFLIIDSWQPACGSSDGGDPAGRTVSTMTSLRSLGVSTLAIAHLSKSDVANGTTGNKIYGSVFTWNLARSIWELRGSQDETADAINIGLYHRKCNVGKLKQPMGFQMAFDAGVVCLHGMDLSRDSDLMKGASNPYRIKDALKVGAMTADEIAIETGIQKKLVQNALSDLKKDKKVVQVKRDKNGVTWGLIDENSPR